MPLIIKIRGIYCACRRTRLHKSVKAERGGDVAYRIIFKARYASVKLGKGCIKRKVGGVLAHKADKHVGRVDKL